MIDKRFLEDLSQQISRLLPQAEAAGEDIKKTVSSALQKSFSRLDLLTREEFDAQQAALSRAQERVTELEADIAMLEARLGELEKKHQAP
ncbi:MAG: accessory factor UbiK family protein [Pseudomonadales bacterium]|nr:accessory factor UbiK family protein [Pseudomonadales bacterium]